MSRLLLVDYGGVLGHHHVEPAESQLAEVLQVSVTVARQLLSERSTQGRMFREDLMTERAFWQQVISHTPLTHSLTDSLVATLSDLWSRTYQLNTEVADLIGQVRGTATVGILTNIDRARSRHLEQVVKVRDIVDLYLPSYMFRATKPAEHLWRQADATVRESLGPEVSVFYVDDRQTHVEACSIVKWHGIMFTGVEALRQQLSDLKLIKV